MAHTTIPIIHIKDFQCSCCNVLLCRDHNNTWDETQFASVRDALHLNGCLFISGHDIDLLTVYEQSKKFFTSSNEYKMLCCSKDRARRGYSPSATENFATLIGEAGKPNDRVEKFRVGPTAPVDPNDPYYQTKEGRIHFFPNDWSHVEAETCDILTSYYNQLQALSIQIIQLLELIYNTSFQALYTDPIKQTSIMSMNYYPTDHTTSSSSSSSKNTKPYERIADHTDVSLLTLVQEFNTLSVDYNTSRNPTKVVLQWYEANTATWHDIRIPPNTFLVNIGECMEYVSAGRMKACRHRVLQYTNTLSAQTEAEKDNNAEASFNQQEGQDEKGEEEDHPYDDCADRFTSAYFYSPPYTTLLQWSSASSSSSSGSESVVEDEKSQEEGMEEGEKVCYDIWRKAFIKKAMASLQPQKSATVTATTTTNKTEKKAKKKQNNLEEAVIET